MIKKISRILPQRTARYYYLRFLRLQGDPRVLARGIAVGLFINSTPIMPFHTILTLLFAVLLRGSKLAALLAGFVITNPLTVFFVYYLCWRLGSLLTGSDLSWEQINAVLSSVTDGSSIRHTLALVGKLGQDAIAVMLVGGVVLATPITFAGYLFSLRFFTYMQEKRLKKLRNLENDNQQSA
jgi:uncharacterized protein